MKTKQEIIATILLQSDWTNPMIVADAILKALEEYDLAEYDRGMCSVHQG